LPQAGINIKMKKTTILYGLAMAILVAVLKALEYRYFVRSLSLEVYMGALATLFTFLGVWIGLKITNKHKPELVTPTLSGLATEIAFLEKLPEANPNSLNPGISNRELEVLHLMAEGLSNQEIADRLFVSLNTIKTHSSNVYAKLEVKRRTQAIQKAKDLKIIN